MLCLELYRSLMSPPQRTGGLLLFVLGLRWNTSTEEVDRSLGEERPSIEGRRPRSALLPLPMMPAPMKPTVAGEADESAAMVATQRVERDRTGRTEGVVRRSVGFYPNGETFFNGARFFFYTTLVRFFRPAKGTRIP